MPRRPALFARAPESWPAWPLPDWRDKGLATRSQKSGGLEESSRAPAASFRVTCRIDAEMPVSRLERVSRSRLQTHRTIRDLLRTSKFALDSNFVPATAGLFEFVRFATAYASTRILDVRLWAARLRWFSFRIFFRNRRFLGVASTYSSAPM